MSPYSLIDVSSMQERVSTIAGDGEANRGRVAAMQTHDEAATGIEQHGNRFALTGALFAGILVSLTGMAATRSLFDEG
ncbi:hypothetical protein [Paraburkholderia sp. J67]|uniref:hypothetical protein n=1 Tax=Paraburkholderia sp. J67 TaxID=2805435 RepID=UPI002ABDC81D|nr:hypothetical protein [Paraburkholderia sp. J67]